MTGLIALNKISANVGGRSFEEKANQQLTSQAAIKNINATQTFEKPVYFRN